MNSQEVKEKILELKNKKNAVILAHNYQILAVQQVADFVGDSLELSMKASQTPYPIIVFAGVKFMAETAKILSPQKKVLLPRLDAGCPMADMITVDDLKEMQKQHPNAKVVTYVNSPIEIKANSDVCCTSANSVKVVESIDADEIIFVPDQNLGSFIQKRVPQKKIILFEGYCYVHNRIKKWEIEEMKKKYPAAEVIAHPEVRPEIIEMADQVLSTSGMRIYIKSSPNREFIVLTEEGLLDRIRQENPEKTILSAFRPKICSNMKKTELEDIYNSLVFERYSIDIDETQRIKAISALDAMLKIH